jgi:hypothetical protein
MNRRTQWLMALAALFVVGLTGCVVGLVRDGVDWLDDGLARLLNDLKNECDGF